MNSPYLDPVTKDYTLVNGNILNTNSIINRMISALELPFGVYIFDKTRGCKIQNQIGNRQVINKKTLEKYIKSCLNFLIEDATLTILNVICIEYTFRQAKFNIYGTASNNATIYLPWTEPL